MSEHQYFDSYIDGKSLDIYTEFAEQLRRRLQSAVRETPVPEGLENRIRASLSKKPSRHWTINVIALAAAIVVCLIPFTLPRPVPALMRIGLDEHIHCTLSHKGPANTFDKLHDLIAVVATHIPSDFSLDQAHECRYRGRHFVHLTFRNGTRVMSLIITRRQDRESLDATQMAPKLLPSGISLYTASIEPFEVAALENRGHLVYTVSDAPRKSLDVLTAVGPALANYLNNSQV